MNLDYSSRLLLNELQNKCNWLTRVAVASGVTAQRSKVGIQCFHCAEQQGREVKEKKQLKNVAL